MPTPPAENRKRKEKEMLFRMQAESKSISTYSTCFALLPSSVFSARSRGSHPYIKITLEGISSGNRCEEEGGSPIWRKEKYGVIFQWKLGLSKICERVTVKVRSTRLFL